MVPIGTDWVIGQSESCRRWLLVLLITILIQLLLCCLTLHILSSRRLFIWGLIFIFLLYIPNRILVDKLNTLLVDCCLLLLHGDHREEGFLSEIANEPLRIPIYLLLSKILVDLLI
jgi:hypothetical protein